MKTHQGSILVKMSTAPGAEKAWLRELEDKYDNMRLGNAVRWCRPHLIKLTSQPEKRAVEQQYNIDTILDNLCMVKAVTPSFVTALNLKKTLDTMRNSTFLSEFAVEVAEEQYKRFDQQGWGTPVTPAAPPTSTTAFQLSDGRRKRKRDNDTQSIGTASSANASASSSLTSGAAARNLYPDPDHPIYGTAGIMKDIILHLNITTGNTTYAFDPNMKKTSARIHGNNNTRVGYWAPFQLCLVRDGVHGSAQGGICGNAYNGAYSIIVTGAYAGFDSDLGEELHYSGPGSHDNKDKNKPHESDGTLALRTSKTSRAVVRVIRGASGGKYAPEVGFRYDGLYRVVEEKMHTNKHGGKYVRFKLVRASGQPALNTLRTTREQLRLFHAAQAKFPF